MSEYLDVINPMTGEPFLFEEYFACTDTITVYNLTDSQFDLINTLAPKMHSKVYKCDTTTDLIAIPSYLSIINPVDISEEEIAMLFEVWQEYNDHQVIFLQDPLLRRNQFTLSSVRVNPDIFEDIESLRLLILHQRSKVERQIKKHRHYEDRIVRILYILHQLQRGSVKTKAIAEKYQVTPRTILRDISILERLGEPIFYDEEEKAFYLVNKESLIWENIIQKGE